MLRERIGSLEGSLVDVEGRLSSPLQVPRPGPPTFVRLVDLEDGFALDFQSLADDGAGEQMAGRIGRQGDRVPNLTDLLRFIKLKDAKPNAYLRFARRWGRLQGLCGHRVPYGLCQHGCVDTGHELVSEWRSWSKVMGAVLNIANSLHDNLPGRKEDLAILVEEEELEHIEALVLAGNRTRYEEGIRVGIERCVIGSALDLMLFESGARLSCEWEMDSAAPVVFLAPSQSLLACLTCQLAFATARVHGVATCDSCMNIYTPTRKPQQGRNKYCDECRSKGPARDYDRRRRSGQVSVSGEDA